MDKIREILKKEEENIEISDETRIKLDKLTKETVKFLNEKARAKKIKAEVFVGGSFAKGTLIKKDKYDIDIYLKFSEEKETKRIDEIIGKQGEKVHGSRDYFRIFKQGITFEIIPIVKQKDPRKAGNVTDLSPFHVNYVRNKIKAYKNLGNEIKLAKVFTYCQGVYGAESYIKGFSGYALELLICYYKSFEKFVKEIANAKDKMILDPEKFYKNKKEILENLNEAKLSSPIILVDPTFKERNALAALSQETFDRFKSICKEFLKRPSPSYFEKKEFDLKEFRKAKGEFVKIVIKTDKQAGDIAGSKLNKFHRFLSSQIGKYFEIVKQKFVYDDAQSSINYFIVRRKKELIIPGPPITSIENVSKFRKAHNDVFIKKERTFAREKVNMNFNKFLRLFKENNKITIKSMSITSIT